MPDLHPALQRALEAVRELATAAERLASKPCLDADEAIRAAARRDAAFAQLGRIVAEHALSGGRVELSPAAPEPAPAPPPPAQEASPAAVPLPAVARAASPPKSRAVAPPPPASEAHEPAPPPAPPEPKPKKATPLDLAALSQHFVVGRPSEPAPAPVFEEQPLASLAERWGTPVELDEPAANARLDEYAKALDDLDTWLEFDKPEQRALLGYAVAQARYAQDVVGGPSALSGRQGSIFRRLTSWSAEHQPGFVWGLAAGHAPKRGTWLDDAIGYWVEELRLPMPRPVIKPPGFTIGDLSVALRDRVPDEILHAIVLALVDHPAVDQDHLTQVLADHADRLSGHAKFKKLKKRIVRLRKERGDDEPEVTEEHEALPADWPWRAHTAGKRVVMLGGDARQASEARIRAVFGIDALSWETGWDNRRVQGLAERIRAGNVDLLLIIQRFVNHTATNAVVPVCKESGVPFVVVAGGYGVNQIRHAIEAKLQPGS